MKRAWMKSIAVYCGSSLGASEIYKKQAILLGKFLAKNNITLIYGGASVGIMGTIADAVLAEGGSVIGVIPAFLEQREIAHKDLTELICVDTMHERKAKMMALADGFIALPGGPGTLEEFFEVFTWNQIGLLQKPCGILNIDGYYNKLIELFDHMVAEKFLQERARNVFYVDDNYESLLNQMNAYTPPAIKTY
jgi:hypothetical protein